MEFTGKDGILVETALLGASGVSLMYGTQRKVSNLEFTVNGLRRHRDIVLEGNKNFRTHEIFI
jgi:hypothetical protein